MRVTTIDKHDIYHISDIDISSGASPLPLMTITTTMKEVIQFAPFIEPPPVVRTRRETSTAPLHTSTENSCVNDTCVLFWYMSK